VLQDYISVKERGAVYVPHTAGRYAAQRFKKATCPVVERIMNAMMMHGRNNGKKLLSLRIVKHTMEIIHLLTGENPVQILVDAVVNSGPREDSTRVGRAGTVRRQAVDVSPLRRVNFAIFLLTSGARAAAFRNIKTISECLADELINAAKVSVSRTHAVSYCRAGSIRRSPEESPERPCANLILRFARHGRIPCTFRGRPTPTPSRRRTSSSVLPSLTDKQFCCMEYNGLSTHVESRLQP